jgi:hypothetical protein
VIRNAIHDLLFCSGCPNITSGEAAIILRFIVGPLSLAFDETVTQGSSGIKDKDPGLRFSTYRKVVVPGKEEWILSTTEVVRLCLEASYQTNQPGNKKD